MLRGKGVKTEAEKRAEVPGANVSEEDMHFNPFCILST